MKSITRLRAVGGSLTVTVPRQIVIAESLRAGELVEIALEKVKKSFFGTAKGVGPFTEEDELMEHE